MILQNHSRHSDEKLFKLAKFAAKGVWDRGLTVVVVDSVSQHFSGWACRSFGNSFKNADVAEANGLPGPVEGKNEFVVLLRVPAEFHVIGDELHPHRSNLRFHPYYRRFKRLQAKFPEGFPYERWEDEFVQIAAHEFRHVWQYQRAKRKGKYGNGGKGEYDAEVHGCKLLNKYREATGRHVIEPRKQEVPASFSPLSKAAKPVA